MNISFSDMKSQIKIKDRLINELKQGTGLNFNLERELIIRENKINSYENEIRQLNKNISE